MASEKDNELTQQSGEGADVNGEAEIKTPIGSVRWAGKKNAELIALLALCLLFVMSYVLFQHLHDSRELHSTFKELIVSQREQTCLLSLPETERKAEYSAPYGFCKRMAR